jgi:hypothetical protein
LGIKTYKSFPLGRKTGGAVLVMKGGKSLKPQTQSL